MRRFNRKWLLVIPIILIVAVAGFVVWAGSAAAPMPEALAALQSDSAVTVKTDGLLEFIPTANQSDVGLIFYPGAKVDPRAYAPMAHALAAQGFLVEIPSMTLNLAIFSINAADPIIAAHPEIKHWALGGHSLGGSMAARYVQGNAQKVDGLLFLASYPDIDLSQLPLKVSVIYGSLDGLATVEKVESTRALLPASTEWVKIEGGDHAQMGWYGAQAGDNPASISREDQQQQVIDAAAVLLNSLKAA
ncbi:MAG: alpha/beta hydrolase [Chloroflexi bacterium]|nr:alpha/beta hydrolase [Chloroflexota bacterium]